MPVMNEQGNIRPLIDEITAVYAGRSFEIIYVDDGSDDGTADELNNAAAAVKQLQVFTMKDARVNLQPYDGALQALRRRLLFWMVMAEYSSDLPALDAALLDIRPARGWPLACVSRAKTGMRQASAFARSVRRTLLGDDHPDSGCGIKIVDRDLFMRLPSSTICTDYADPYPGRGWKGCSGPRWSSRAGGRKVQIRYS